MRSSQAPGTSREADPSRARPNNSISTHYGLRHPSKLAQDAPATRSPPPSDLYHLPVTRAPPPGDQKKQKQVFRNEYAETKKRKESFTWKHVHLDPAAEAVCAILIPANTLLTATPRNRRGITGGPASARCSVRAQDEPALFSSSYGSGTIFP